MRVRAMMQLPRAEKAVRFIESSDVVRGCGVFTKWRGVQRGMPQRPPP